jgi:hypothetical protein
MYVPDTEAIIMNIRQLTKDSEGVEIKLTIELDESDFNFDSGEPEEDAELISEIEKRLSNSDTWAWCVVTVTASWGGWIGTSVIGGCSYEDEADFRKDGYFDSMVEEAIDELNKNVGKAAKAFEKLIELGEGLSV